MTLIGYFNALRELGGARRIIEDEVRNGLLRYGTTKRVGETDGLFVRRNIGSEPVERTSRVTTSDVAANKRRLELQFSNKNRADVAIATNMILVGLDDASRLNGRLWSTETSAEYIQASSRVGRDPHRPGLVGRF